MRALTLPLLLATSLTMIGCQTQTTEQRAAELDRAIVERICREAWLPQSYDSELDSPQTVEEAQERNRSRAAFCR